MEKSAFIGAGHGYEISERGRCTLFDGYEILANPLGGFDAAARESRVFNREGETGVTYASHAVYLLRGTEKRERGFYVAVHHGSGRRLWTLPACFGYNEQTIAALLAMPERALYSLLWGVVEALESTKRAAESETAQQWRRAALDKRIKTRKYPARGVAKVWIEPERLPDETDAQWNLRKQFAAP